MQELVAKKRQERKQRAFDGKRKAAHHRIEQKIAKADREVAERIAARRAESELVIAVYCDGIYDIRPRSP